MKIIGKSRDSLEFNEIMYNIMLVVYVDSFPGLYTLKMIVNFVLN